MIKAGTCLSVIFLLFFFSRAAAQRHDTIRVDELISAARAIEMSNPDSAIIYGNEGLLLARKLKDKKRMSILYRRLGNAWNVKGDLGKNFEYQNKSLDLAREIGYMAGIAGAYGNLGNYYYILGNMPMALDCQQKSLSYNEKIKDEQGIARSLGNIGLIYMDLKEDRKSLLYQFQSYKKRIAMADTVGLALATGNIAVCYQRLELYDSAYYFFKEALVYNKAINSLQGLAILYSNVGSIFFEKKAYDSSIVNYRRAYDLSNAIGDLSTKGHSALGLADNLAIQKNFNPKVISLTDTVLKLAAATRELGLYRNCYHFLQSYYRTHNRPKEALFYFDKYIHVKDSIQNEEKSAEMARKEMQYAFNKQQEVEKAEQEKKDLQTIAKSRQQKLIIYSAIAGLLIVLVFSLWLVNRLRLIRKQKEIIELQKHTVEAHQKEIVDSIHYAKRIQTTLLAHEAFIGSNVPDHFVLFKPKDIVSGDFYWATGKNGLFYLAACDSTGHGVPGAFMSLLNISFLNEAINEKNLEKPNEILGHVRRRLIETISTEGGQDGMDAILVCIDHAGKSMTYAAANNAPLMISNGILSELEKDKMPVGKGEKEQGFRLFTLPYRAGTMLYLQTDGYADQFGGPKGKKFKYKQLNELLVSVSSLPMYDQKARLLEVHKSWSAGLEQVDDILLIGIRI